ncbi:DUF6894 family protein [Pararoseomonas indoligenes]|uniref:DUF6894 domain-containing protein n=1 Tax=Roseomonas indoligenes TaxID=2820811 RepID=A0A940N9I6_9PROT|nr:hypothetical protein [Pararoseomonas indoligenes]MBP0496507.1 hypothetical protein [Pararoseomonas indoligenes]
MSIAAGGDFTLKQDGTKVSDFATLDQAKAAGLKQARELAAQDPPRTAVFTVADLSGAEVWKVPSTSP